MTKRGNLTIFGFSFLDDIIDRRFFSSIKFKDVSTQGNMFAEFCLRK